MSLAVSAEREVAAPAGSLFTYLADLEQHWQLADRFIEVVSLERPPGGRRWLERRFATILQTLERRVSG